MTSFRLTAISGYLFLAGADGTRYKRAHHSKQWGVNMRSKRAVSGIRKIRPNRRSVTGFVPSRKMPHSLAFESTLERDGYMLLEWDPLVTSITVQQTIKWDGKTYTPDSLVLYSNTSLVPTLQEYKYRKDLFEQWPELHPRLLLGVQFAKSQGWQFKILTEREIRTPRLGNVKKLWRYRSWTPPQEDCALILSAISSRRIANAAGLVHALAQQPERKAALLATIWHLLSIGILNANLDEEPLTNSTPLWVAAERSPSE